jgi:DNA replication protein DnaC
MADDPESLGALVDRSTGSSETRPCNSCGAPALVPPYLVGRASLPVWCPKCSEIEERRFAVEGQTLNAEETARRAEGARANWLKQNGPGTRLVSATLAAYRLTEENRPAFEIAKAWLLRDPRPNLIIVGPIGSGKSYLAAALFHELLTGNCWEAQAQWPIWLRAQKLLAMIKDGFGDEVARRQAATQCAAAKEVPLLFLDDLGKTHPGKDASWVEDQLYGIVDERYCEMRPTVVTTEWRQDALAERCGESVVSRLIDGVMVANLRSPAKPYRDREQTTRKDRS